MSESVSQDRPYQELSPEEVARRNELAMELIQGWLDDESGYDEEVWPQILAALEEERRRTGARPLFDD